MRFILAILIAIGLIVGIFVLIFRGGGNEAQQEAQRIDLNRYAETDASVQVTVDGRLVPNQEHKSYRITVNRTEARMQVYSGYQNTVIAERAYPNNQVAYTNFIKSLAYLSYTDVDRDAPADERGYCPSGQRYAYQLVEGGRDVVRGWNSSCGRSQGNFRGQADNIRQLFNQQIPDYSALLRGTGL